MDRSEYSTKIAVLCILLLFSVLPVFAEGPKTITVLDFETSGVSSQEMVLIVDYLSSAIADNDDYVLIDRRQRKNILAEAEFSNSGCADESCALEIGRLLSAGEMIVGSLGKVGSLFLLNMKLLDVTTGRTIHTGSSTFSSIEDLVLKSKEITRAFLSGEKIPDMAATTGDDKAAVVEDATPSFIPIEIQTRFDGYTFTWEGISYRSNFGFYTDLFEDINGNYPLPEDLEAEMNSYRKKVSNSAVFGWVSLGAGVLGMTAMIASIPLRNADLLEGNLYGIYYGSSAGVFLLGSTSGLIALLTGPPKTTKEAVERYNWVMEGQSR